MGHPFSEVNNVIIRVRNTDNEKQSLTTASSDHTNTSLAEKQCQGRGGGRYCLGGQRMPCLYGDMVARRRSAGAESRSSS